MEGVCTAQLYQQHGERRRGCAGTQGERSVSMKSSKQWPLWEAQVGGHAGASWGILGLFSKLVGGGLFQP